MRTEYTYSVPNGLWWTFCVVAWAVAVGLIAKLIAWGSGD